MSCRKYRANIKIKGTKIALGAYHNEIDAAKAFDRAAIRYRGAKAEVNFPKDCQVGAMQSAGPPQKKRGLGKDSFSGSKSSSDHAPRSPFKGRTSQRIMENASKAQYHARKDPLGRDPLDLCGSDFLDAFEDDSHFQEIHSPFMTCNAVSSTAGGPSIIAVNKDRSQSPKSELSSIDEDAPHLLHPNMGSGTLIDPRYFDCELDSPERDNDNYMGSDESARSHGLSMLEGRGFKLGSANEWSHLRRASSDSLPPAPSAFPSPFERQPSRTRGLEYRQLLIQRALMEADTDRDCNGSDASSLGGVEAVTFAEWPGSHSRDLWWRRQLTKIQGHQNSWERGHHPDSFPRYNSAHLVGRQTEYM